MYKESIGIVGGFGAYATLRFYKRILEAFSSDCERNYPHIYMDNNFTMPSRTRALLYGDEYENVVAEIAESLKKMCVGGVNYIFLICGTAHAFLPDVFKIVPEAEERVINLLNCLADYFNNHEYEKALIIAAEGSLKMKVYESVFDGNIDLINPGEESFGHIRGFIEAVKRNKISQTTYTEWIAFLKIFDCKNIVLGCTEFPVLVEKLRQYDDERLLDEYNFIDPLEIALEYVKQIIQ